jgi:hypothetical protein
MFFNKKTKPTDNWTNLSTQLLAFTGYITDDITDEDDSYNFTFNNIKFKAIVEDYCNYPNIYIQDPECTAVWIKISPFIPAMKKITNHIQKQYYIQRTKQLNEKQLIEKSHAEQILFGGPR